jgi:hypothetical protein
MAWQATSLDMTERSRRNPAAVTTCHFDRSEAEWRMERFGKPRHRRAGRKAERAGANESNLLLFIFKTKQ